MVVPARWGVRMIGVLGAAAALLLAGAGIGKLLAPDAAARMLVRAWPGGLSARSARGVRHWSGPAVRAAGIAEVLVAAAFLARGGSVAAALLAGCYLMFGVVTVQLMRSGERTSCGCFGRAESPVGRAHLAVNVACCAVALAAVAQPVAPLGGLTGAEPATAVIGAAQAVLLAWLGYLTITALPALAAARRLEDPR